MLVEPELIELPIARPESYITIPSIKRQSELILDNLGFMYYKNKSTENKV